MFGYLLYHFGKRGVTTNTLKIKILPITFEIVTDQYAENKNLADYF